MWSVLIVHLLVWVAGSSAETNLTSENGLDFSQLVSNYYRSYGVHNIIIINNASDSQRHVGNIIEHLQNVGFYVRIFNYCTTTIPCNFHIPRSNHKTGILLQNYVNPYGLGILRWSARPENNLFVKNNFWLLSTADFESDLVFLENADMFIPPDSEVRILSMSNASYYNITDIYKVTATSPIRQRVVAVEIRHKLDLINALNTFGSAISYRKNLQGMTFNTGLVIAFPDLFTNIEDVRMRHIDTISKVNNRLTVEMANSLNLRFNTYQTDNYGWRQANGSFDGLMGRFQRNEIDFAQNAIFMRLDRIALCDFVAETYRIRAGMMFRQPSLSAVENIFAMPFDKNVWFAIFVIMICTATVLELELFFAPYQFAMDFMDCGIFIWGALCQQSFHVAVENRSARIIVFTTFVTTLFLFTSFSASIVSLLQSPSNAIQSLKDLAQSPLDIGVQDTVYNKIYFNESTDPTTKLIYEKKIAPKGDGVFMKPKVGIAKMRNGLFAYQVELQAGYQIISETFSEIEKCGLSELEPFQLPMIAIPTRKNLPYKELFRRQLRWQREVGLMNREELKWFPHRPKCEGGLGGFVSIGLTECRYALIIFYGGILVALLWLIMEHLLKHCIKHKFYLNDLPPKNSSSGKKLIYNK